jgi:WD40 repeat protein
MATGLPVDEVYRAKLLDPLIILSFHSTAMEANSAIPHLLKVVNVQPECSITAFLPLSAELVVAAISYEDRTNGLEIWDLQANVHRAQEFKEAHRGDIVHLQPGPSAGQFVSVSLDSIAKLWDTRSGIECVRRIQTEAGPLYRCALAGEALLAASQSNGDQV